jgi:hypothetical protein
VRSCLRAQLARQLGLLDFLTELTTCRHNNDILQAGLRVRLSQLLGFRASFEPASWLVSVEMPDNKDPPLMLPYVHATCPTFPSCAALPAAGLPGLPRLLGRNHGLGKSLKSVTTRIHASLNSCHHNVLRFLCVQLSQLLGSQGFLDFLERGYGSERAGPNMLDKVMLATESGARRGDSVLAVPATGHTEIITVQSSMHVKEGTSTFWRGSRSTSRRISERPSVLERRVVLWEAFGSRVCSLAVPVRLAWGLCRRIRSSRTCR